MEGGPYEKIGHGKIDNQQVRKQKEKFANSYQETLLFDLVISKIIPKEQKVYMYIDFNKGIIYYRKTPLKTENLHSYTMYRFD